MRPKKKIWVWILLLLYAAPPAVYVATFGSDLSSDHARWAEFGSAMAGIYAPIVALSTLAVLFVQVSLQRQINNHHYLEAHLQQARADIEFYGIRIAQALDTQLLPGKTMREILHANFQPSSIAALDDENLRTLAANIDSHAPSTIAMWFAMYPIFANLAKGKGVSFEVALNSSLIKTIALLSFETCVALDNFHRTRTEGKLKVDYPFSRLLSSKAVRN